MQFIWKQMEKKTLVMSHEFLKSSQNSAQICQRLQSDVENVMWAETFLMKFVQERIMESILSTVALTS